MNAFVFLSVKMLIILLIVEVIDLFVLFILVQLSISVLEGTNQHHGTKKHMF